tara:strand:- start:71 stop:1222 length:1152 start_codon:yes stop_codon:yes gene_type:complete
MFIKQLFVLLLLKCIVCFKNFKKTSIISKRYMNNLKSENDYQYEYYKYLIDFDLIKDNNLLGETFIDEIIEKRKDNFELFKKNLKKIEEFNSQNNSFTLAINQFTDTYNDSYSDYYSKYFNESYDLMQKKLSIYDIIKYDFVSIKQLIENPKYYLDKYRNISESLIWDSSVVSSVKNQGRCGSCWAFSTTNSIEANMRINNLNTTHLSEQELVDCSKENNGCLGGLMHLAYDYCIENDGLTSDLDYPYNAKTGVCNLTCSNSTLKVSNKIKGSNIKNYNFIVPRSVIDIMASLKRGPIAIALDASPFEFRFYNEGIIDINPSNKSKLNHAVLLTGYSKYENGSYWLIQNSWGEKWGDNGYVKIKIENGNGILLSQLYGVYPFN